MEPFVLWLIKIFEKEEWADQFMSRELYLNRLSRFKKLEDTQSDGRPDKNEGVATLLHKAFIEVKQHPSLNIAPENLACPISISFDRHSDLHVLCMTAIHTGEFEFDRDTAQFIYHQDDAEKRKRQIEVEEDCLKLGRFAVVTRAYDFIHRALVAVEQAGYAFNSSLAACRT